MTNLPFEARVWVPLLWIKIVILLRWSLELSSAVWERHGIVLKVAVIPATAATTAVMVISTTTAATPTTGSSCSFRS